MFRTPMTALDDESKKAAKGVEDLGGSGGMQEVEDLHSASQ